MSSEPSTPPAAPKDEEAASRRLRQATDALLARPATLTRGSVDLATTASAARGALGYEARVEFLPVLAAGFEAAEAEPLAAVMTTSYLQPVPDGGPSRERPVCFAFNGGPGSASLWLHLGALGPKRVVVPDDASAARAPFGVVDNPHTWLAHFDLVFIDPPATGWSLCASAKARDKVLGVDGDVDALAEVVRAWLTRHRRWGSPVYLAGESYGTTRAAALADALQTAGVALSGVVLVSCAIDLQTLVFAPANELPYALFVPAMALTSQHHGLLRGAIGASGDAALEAATRFVHDDYLGALHAGGALEGRARTRVAARLSELTGLPRALVEQRNLRITDQCYFVEALRARGRVVGRLDARATAPMAASQEHELAFDPGIEAIAPAYTSAALGYYAEALGVTIEARYEALNRAAHSAWNWNRGTDKGNGYACTSPDLARALRRNPHLRVFVASGRYDLGTPVTATDWSLAHLDIGPEVAARVEHRRYDAGHMMYTRTDDLVRLGADLAHWLQQGAHA